MFGKIKSILGLLNLFAIPIVYSAEHKIFGAIGRSPGLEDGKVQVLIILDGVTLENKLYRLQKTSPCTNNCTYVIVYDNGKLLRFNSGGVEYDHSGQIYNIGYFHTEFDEKKCTGIQDCDDFMLKFETTFSTLNEK
ncbi:hypothetical protein BB559_000160 [Furculomyces boomerangus]|uniref:Uncharacterized protein n=1 Tax=Furculomyces boomerangus TaxID=61424 RepID=A0A2T9Z616_9FUNG|nr:hypothetical protein BB559_000160 [Furculomyces boomerangus]